MEMVNVTVDGIQVEVPKGSTALEAARVAGIKIPTLCYLKDLNEIGACRMCLVEVKETGAFKLLVYSRGQWYGDIHQHTKDKKS